MTKIKKIITLSLMVLLIFTTVVFAQDDVNTVVLTDLDETYWAYESIDKLVEAGVIEGYTDGTFKPDGDITRAELVKIANLVFVYTQKQESTNFTDVKSDDWFYENILIAQEAGYIKGYPDNTFKPDQNITRQEFCTILDSINSFVELPYDGTVADEVSTWAVEYVNKVVSNRIMTLDENSNFRATENATRAEVCDALAKFVILEETVGDTSLNGGLTDNPTEDLSQQEIYDAMERVSESLENKVITKMTTDLQKEIINDIINNMDAYKLDSSHDYEKAAEDVYDKYKELTEEQRDDLKYQIQIQNSTKDLLELKDFFFPAADL